jgi:hypothetical protein
MTDKRLRSLEREYRRERAEVLADKSISWERRMRRISEIYAHYLDRIDELRGAASEAEEEEAS